jgi:hypothetical protein
MKQTFVDPDPVSSAPRPAVPPFSQTEDQRPASTPCHRRSRHSNRQSRRKSGSNSALALAGQPGCPSRHGTRSNQSNDAFPPRERKWCRRRFLRNPVLVEAFCPGLTRPRPGGQTGVTADDDTFPKTAVQVATEIGDEDVCALPRKCQGHRAANAGISARYDRLLAL